MKSVWQAKRQRIGKEKLTAQCPAWLRLAEDRHSFTVIEERAAIVRRIYQLNNDGMGHHRIAQLLNTEGISSWGKRENGWHDSYVLSILRTKAVLGEFQPHRRERGEHRRAIPTGDPILDYYPPLIDLATWQRAQSRRQTSTPGRVGERVANLFSGLIWDGYNGTSMRFMSRRPRPDSNDVRQGKWHYLVSDYGRLKKGAKACSWRYPWFKTWFLNYIVGLDWDALAREKVPADELALETKLAAQQNKLHEIERSLARLVALATTSNSPPKSLLAQMAMIEEQKLDGEQELVKVAREAENVVAKRNAIQEAAIKIKKLVALGSYESRLKLREEIRRKIERIDLYPDGASDEILKDEPLRAPGWPCFRIVFANGASRWVFCPNKKPGQDLNPAPLGRGLGPDEMSETPEDEEGLEPIQFVSTSEEQVAVPEPSIDARQAAPSRPNVEFPDEQQEGPHRELARRDKNTKTVRNSTPPLASRS